MSQPIVALDMGTTGTRAIAFDAECWAVAQAYTELTQHFPRPGWVEHDPHGMWAGLRTCAATLLEQVDADHVAALAITNQRETAILRRQGRTGVPGALKSSNLPYEQALASHLHSEETELHYHDSCSAERIKTCEVAMPRPSRFSCAHAIHHVPLRSRYREIPLAEPTVTLFPPLLQEARVRSHWARSSGAIWSAPSRAGSRGPKSRCPSWVPVVQRLTLVEGASYLDHLSN